MGVDMATPPEAIVGLLKPISTQQLQVMTADSTEEKKAKGLTQSKRKSSKKSASKKSAPQSDCPSVLVKHHHSVKKPQTPSVSRRNARERNRVKQVNNGFATLRNHIPHLKSKTSKVDTLRAAVDYIEALRSLVGVDAQDFVTSTPMKIFVASSDEDDGESVDGENDSSKNKSGVSRSASALSGENINPMVYQLPQEFDNRFVYIVNRTSWDSHYM